tara:strand:- start:388 stop:585 length:198 start_codon:yes stop_codon:yes gene_type:complete
MEPEFLKVKPGNTVLIGESEIANFLTIIGSSRDSDLPTLFQAANVDTGENHWIHAEEIKGIFSAK